MCAGDQQFLHLPPSSIRPSICPSIHPTISPYVHVSIILMCIHPSALDLAHKPIYLCAHPLIYPCHPSSLTYLHPSISSCLATHPCFHASGCLNYSFVFSSIQPTMLTVAYRVPQAALDVFQLLPLTLLLPMTSWPLKHVPGLSHLLSPLEMNVSCTPNSLCVSFPRPPLADASPASPALAAPIQVFQPASCSLSGPHVGPLALVGTPCFSEQGYSASV